MIICKKCKRLTEVGEPTGTLRFIEDKRIVMSQRVCLDCSGETKKSGGRLRCV